MVKKMVLVNIFGVIILNMKVNGKIIFYVVMVFINSSTKVPSTFIAPVFSRTGSIIEWAMVQK